MRSIRIPEFSDYSVYDMGQVYSHRGAGRYLEGRLKIDGYVWVTLMKDGKYYHRPLHFLVAQAFVPNPDNLEWPYHKNGYKLDNHYINLEWRK